LITFRAGFETETALVFEDLNYAELKRRANEPLPDRVIARLEARGQRRSVAAGEVLYRVDDREYPLVFTGWLKDTVRLDDRGFILTGEDCGMETAVPFNVFQTNLPGVFAVGDVRSGSVKRVASAVGEGSVVVQAIHARLAAPRQT
jgi:NADPH-dependent glutamate synthase beta subunit-like oxidoreductase